MESGEIAAWLAALFAGATFTAWIVDKWRAKRNSPAPRLDVKLMGTLDDGEVTRDVARVTNSGDAPAQFFLGGGSYGMYFSHCRFYVTDGYIPPPAIPPGGECKVLLEDLDRDTAYVRFIHQHPRLRWYQIEWHALESDSSADNELARQFQIANDLPRWKKHRHLRSAPVGPNGVPRVVLRPKSRALLQEMTGALGTEPIQPYMRWWKRPRLWGTLTKPFRRHRTADAEDPSEQQQ